MSKIIEGTEKYTLFFRQTWTVLGVLLTMLGTGMILSYPYVLLPGLKADDSAIKTDIQTMSWLASAVGPANFPGFVASALLMDLWGRKVTQIIANALGILGWFLIYFARNVPALMAGRILGGMSCGMGLTVGSVIIGEYSSPKHRGMFLNLKTAAVCLGYTILHITSHYYSWRNVSIFGLAIYSTSFAMVFTWPESPAWLATRCKFNQSEKAWFWLRGHGSKSRVEFNRMVTAQKQINTEVCEKSMMRRMVEFLHKFTEKDFVKPTLVMFFSVMLLEACGRHNFPAYALKIMEEITGEKSKSFYYTLVIDLITTLSTTSSSVLVRMIKRRTLLFTTGGAALVILTGICTYLYLTSIDLISKDRAWLPVSMFILYFLFVNFGCTVIPLTLLGELYPLGHRSAGMAMSGCFLSSGLLISLKITPELLEYVKVYGTFAISGSAMAVALVALYFILPETKDRTLQEIQDYFNHGQFHCDEKVQLDEEEDTEMLSYKK